MKMTFDKKVKFLRTLPQFKVAPISEVRAVAFAIRELSEPTPEHYIIGLLGTTSLVLTRADIEKIVRTYPDPLEKFKTRSS